MSSKNNFLRKWQHAKRGASMQGYGLVVGLIAVVAISAVSNVGSGVKTLFGKVGNELTSVVDGSGLSGGSGGGSTPAPDTTPNSFSFIDVPSAALSTPVTSDIIAISGIDTAAAISVSGDASTTYRICANGTCSGTPAFTAIAATINNGDFVQLQLTSSALELTTSTATLDIGGVTDSWQVTTVMVINLTFSTCGASAENGPASASVCNTEYGTTGTGQTVTVSGGIQTWTVPVTGTYRITALGAKGADAFTVGSGGLGALAVGDISLTINDQILILVGQEGAAPTSPSNRGTGGGGGSFVVHAIGNVPLVIAGGGGGTAQTLAASATPGTYGQSSTAGDTPIGIYAGAGGTAGGGGGGATNGTIGGGGGAGFLGTGNGGTGIGSNADVGGFAFLNGGRGGLTCTSNIHGSNGGFGGGGAGEWCNVASAGGGGGYSGGGGGGNGSVVNSGEGGGGGGSYVDAGATNDNKTTGGAISGGHGSVTIELQ